MKSILVTGGTGSFGQAFTRRLLSGPYQRIVIFSRGEHAQETMEREFDDPRLRFFIGDVRDRQRLEMAMRGIDTVVHAAALKIVPIAEYNPTECVATNIGGAENVVRAALRTNVERVIALSTDKAVNPVNLYGASKLAAEKIFMAANNLAAGTCAFSVVRYGNVAGSRGSVLPLFKKWAAEGKPLKITDARMTRFWIDMDRAIDLVMSAKRPGCIYVSKLPSVRVLDLAAAISHLPVEYTGIRPGEKLHETLLTEDEARTTTEYPDMYVIHPSESGNIREDFRYSSDTNTHWLSVGDLKKMV